MKALKYSIFGSLAALTLGMTACQDSYDAPELQVPQATIEANISIADFKSKFCDELAVQTPYMDEANKTPYIIHGRVISSDASGNIYKSLVIQDETGAIAFSVNQSSMYVDWRLGQEVVVNATDLWFGQYNNYLQFGWLGEYNGMPQITFMAYDIFNANAQKNGMPNQNFRYGVTLSNYSTAAPANQPYCVTTSIDELLSLPAGSDEYYFAMSQLVEIPNVRFVDAGKDPAETFSTYQNTVDRYITDASGRQLNVRCSGYSSFYNEPLPEGTGTIRGILSRYGDSWQLLLRGMEDVVFDSKGSKDEPYSIEDAIAFNNNGMSGWVEGYVIGSVASNVSNVSSLDDIIFTAADAELDNNLVIAPTPDCRDLEKMMTVNLPAGSKIRLYANLMDNPDVLGHKLLVNGSFDDFLGMHGVTGVGAGAGVFEVIDLIIPGLNDQGNGTESSPYLPGFIINNPEDMENVWISGYIVGFVAGTDIQTGAEFNANAAGKNYSGNNVLIGIHADSNSLNEAIPVMLGSFRADYRLDKKPEMLGKKVLIKGNVGLAFGVYGVSSISEIRTLE